MQPWVSGRNRLRITENMQEGTRPLNILLMTMPIQPLIRLLTRMYHPNQVRQTLTHLLMVNGHEDFLIHQVHQSPILSHVNSASRFRQ
jgi:hypothetical protein